MLLWEGSGSQINKFEQVSSDLHQMSLAGGRGRSPGMMSMGEGVLYHITYPTMHLMLPTPSPRGQTDACKTLHSRNSFAGSESTTPIHQNHK